MIRTPHAWLGISYTGLLSNTRIIFEDIGDTLGDFFSNSVEYLKHTVEHLILVCVLYVVICVLFYLCIKWRVISFNREVRNSKRILFVIAHPDDECMFFGPMLLNYTRKENCLVYLMCLSTGRNNGMGSTRKKELYEACEVLGIQQSNIFIHNHTCLPDAMDVRWPSELVSKQILHHLDSLNITTLVTFDRYGISNHCNHSSIYYAVANLILDRRLPKYCGVYVLETINILRKYWLLLDIPLSFILSRIRYLIEFEDRYIIHRAMEKHKSQLVWFRKLYMLFSRYTMINTLQQMNLVDIELDLELDD